ncbi:glycosyltransferase family 39 protein [Baekduia sp. Peel2402]|uniref:glycosyltransferase family 39 protein n=1 Tax=Baekduia sp. Peel2402 TaxID=3458296 RepID=UPI00403E4EBD
MATSTASADRPALVRGDRAGLPRWAWMAGLAAACLLDAWLRLWAFGRVPPNPWYDQAVRSMGLSWHNLFFGALEPGGTISIDKPPIDLWLQVASTKALGFSSTALRLPQALAGVAAVPLLYDLVRRGFGHRAALISALALAVLPVSVLTGRSDTMDTLMSTLLLVAVWLIAAAPDRRKPAAVATAGAVAGLAFEVKLFEMVVGLPAIAAAAWYALHPAIHDRPRTLRRAAIAFVAVAAAWPVAAAIAPGPHPWPAGSSDGTIANVILVYNGISRLGPPTPGSFSATLPPPGPLRLFSARPPDRYLRMLGIELLGALMLSFLAFGLAIGPRWAARAPIVLDRTRAGVGAGIAAWLLCGYAFFSIQGRPRLRYFEAFTPAVAAGLGIGAVVAITTVARRQRWPAPVASLLLGALTTAVLAWPLATSAHLARAGVEDSQTLGAFPPAEVAALSRYLQGHQHGARYEVATADTIVGAPLVARDGRPIVVLTSWFGRPFTPPERLAALVRAGDVRYVLLDSLKCDGAKAPACAPSVRWAIAHGTDVSSAAGLGAERILLRVRATP